MAHFQNQYAAVPQTQRNEDSSRPTDEYDNPVVQTDKHGIPVHHTATTGVYKTGGGGGGYYDTTIETGMRGHGGGAPAAGTGIGGGHHHGLHRSGSSSSSSSSSEEEDDGQGGRRRKKKGLKEKIKGILPGVGHKDDDDRSSVSAITTNTPEEGYDITGGEGHLHHQQQLQQEHEKKGTMEKIKEKLTGHHH